MYLNKILMLRTVCKKSLKDDQLGRIVRFPPPCKGNTSQPAATRRVSPPEQSPCKGSITIITFSIGMLPFQGGVLLVLTRRVAAGWLMLPLKGREKLTILPDIKILMLMYGYRLFAYRV
jgi:hypothetical protein